MLLIIYIIFLIIQKEQFVFFKPIITNHTETTDESTVICPLCNIDAILTCSVIPNKRTLKKWRKLGFGDN